MIISQVGQVLVGLVDTAMVGQLGAVPLAGVTFANAIFFPFYVGGMGVAMGLTPLVSRALVRGNSGRIRSLVKNSVVLNSVLGVGLMLLFAGCVLLMPYMGQDPETLEVAIPYGWLMVLSMLPIYWMYTLRHFLEGLGNTIWAMVATLLANSINVLLNYMFIYGMWGAPEMGAGGAGLATLISRVLMFLILWFVVVRVPRFNYYLKGFWSEAVRRFRVIRLWRMGYPIAVQIGAETMSFGLMAIVIGTFGAVNIAGHQIAANMPHVAFMMVTGVANATTILVSRNYALNLHREVRAILRSALIIVILFMIFTSNTFIILSENIAQIFTPDPAVQDVAVYLLLFASMFQISDGIQGVAVGALRGVMDVKRPMIYSFCAYAFVGAPVAYICGFVLEMEAAGIWLGIVAAIVALSILYLRRFYKIVPRS